MQDPPTHDTQLTEFARTLQGFFNDSSKRFLHIVVPAHVYTHTLAWLRALSRLQPAQRLCVFPTPFAGPARGWPSRLRELALAFPQNQSSGFADEPDTPDPLEAFARTTAKLSLDESSERLILVLAPQHIEDMASYVRDIHHLLSQPELGKVRWIVADAAHSSLGDFANQLGDTACQAFWIEASARADADIDDLLQQLESQADRLPEELESRIPRDSPLRLPQASALRQLLVEADRRLAAGRPREAAQLFSQAENVIGSQGMHEEAILVSMQLARALIAAGHADEGQRVFAVALKKAEAAKMMTIVPEAYASLGSLHVRKQQFLNGYEAYVRSSETAQFRGSLEFGADMYRCAGHAALNANLPKEALTVWTKAFELLSAIPPDVGQLDQSRQIMVLALALADAFEHHGNLAAARGLRGHADAIERRSPRNPQGWS